MYREPRTIVRHHPKFISGTDECSICETLLTFQEVERQTNYDCGWCGAIRHCTCEYQKETIYFYKCESCATCPICKKQIDKEYGKYKSKSYLRENDDDSDEDDLDVIEANNELYHTDCFLSEAVPKGELQLKYDRSKKRWYVQEVEIACERCLRRYTDCEGTWWRDVCDDCVGKDD